MHKNDFVGVVSPRDIYVGIGDRAAFDIIALDVKESPGVLVKVVEQHGVVVVFQYWMDDHDPKNILDASADLIDGMRKMIGAA